MLLGIIAVIIFLSILILAHELGHFLAAKKFGLLVEEFGFGLPPRIWGKKIGETIYSINALPFGGFVKIYGEDREDATPKIRTHPNIPNKTQIIEKELSYKINGLLFDVHKELGRFCRERQYASALENKLRMANIRYKREQPVSLENQNSNIVDFIIEDKIVVELKSKLFILKEDFNQIMRYLEATNIELGLIVNFRSKYLKPKRILNPRVRVDSGHSDEFVISGRNKRSFSDLPIIKRAIIVSAGVLMNFLLGWLVISVVFSVGLPPAVLITDVRANSPAAEVGLQTGDKVAGFSNIGEFIKYIDQNRGKEIDLKIERSGKEIGFRTTPRLNPPVGEGALGIGLVEAGLPKQNIAKSFIEGFKASVGIIKTIFVALINLISKAVVGKATLEAVAGPVGIVKITAQAGSLGFVYLLQLLALISLNLAVINIFPFPALDGGRLLFLLIEKIKGSPLPAKSERYANAAGMALLLFLMALITIKDIGRFL